ncbi:ATP-binding protein [Hyalangium sp.]|uniref:ATP-binding protein n=1 Tax=Hyalangium sp. TaxID=2028555 RepID=UPI002D3C173E|nr:ATP-binding protein [Hyalangium sp.]HYI02971.1 ATP-binding protein [Hyalangium sp.]
MTDTGIGIPPEFHERIFEEFTQVDTPLHKKVKGTGLGLTLARSLTEMLGGALTLQSTPGQGSSFTITLPRVHPGETAALLAKHTLSREVAIARIRDALSKAGLGSRGEEREVRRG